MTPSVASSAPNPPLIDRSGTPLEQRHRHVPLPPPALVGNRADVVPGATITFTLTVTGIPTGVVHQRWHVVDAVLDRVEDLDRAGDPSLGQPHLPTTLDRLVGLLDGHLEVVELPEGPTLQGSWTELMLMAGLLDSPAWRDAFADVLDLYRADVDATSPTEPPAPHTEDRS